MENLYKFEDADSYSSELMRVEFEVGPDGRSYPDAESEAIVGNEINFQLPGVVPKLGSSA